MMDFLDFSASAATGGIVGLVGTALGRVAGIYEARQTQRHERERWTHERALEAARSENEAREAAQEREQSRHLASYEGLGESLRNDSAIGESYRWVGAVRALVRPVLTPLLWAVYLVVFFAVVNGNAAHFLDEEAQGEFIGYFIANIAFAASAATLWWFGDRARPPRGSGER
tara:strand:- start:1082 stop:1597 length:516 start_codon:yes stop_codon:yes gene_type:complete